MSRSGRPYAGAVGWLKAARPAELRRTTFAGRAFKWTFAAAIAVMGAIALTSPEKFSRPGSDTLATGWPAYLVAGLAALCLVPFVAARGRLLDHVHTIREPFSGAGERTEEREQITAALVECSGLQQTRFALARIWAPAALTVLGGVFTFASAYFVIDAVISRFEVGWQQGALFAANAALALVCFALVAGRLSTLGVAAAAYRDATIGGAEID